MAIEQPESPSVEPAAPDAPASEPRSELPPTEENRSFFSRLFRRGRGDEDPSTDAPEAAPAATSSSTLTLTQEELDRRIQAETDRRETRRQQREAAEARRKLRDEDPWSYAEQDREAERRQSADTQVTDMFQQIGTAHDQVTLDPLMHALPDKERQRILELEGAGRGLEGRKLLTHEALKVLEKHWKDEGARDAERKLRSNPAFRKQVLAEARGVAVEPDLLPAQSASEADRTVSAILRRQMGIGHREAR